MYKLTLLLLIINFGCNSNSKEASFSSLKNNKGMRISDVAHESGYNDSRYFSTTFKKFFGKSPKDY